MGDLVFSEAGVGAIEAALGRAASALRDLAVPTIGDAAIGAPGLGADCAMARTVHQSMGDTVGTLVAGTRDVVVQAGTTFGSADQVMSETILKGFEPFEAHSDDRRHLEGHHGGAR